MTTEPDHERIQNADQSNRSASRRPTAGPVLKAAGTRIRDDPVLVVPFAVAGLLVAVADWLRNWDPIPAATPDSFGQTVNIEFSIVPSGTPRTVRHVDALVDLQTPYLVGAVALEAIVFVAVGLAGWLTITRALNTDRQFDSLASYLGFFAAVVVPPHLLDYPTLDFSSLLLGGVAIIVFSLVVVRVFLVPGLLAAGKPFSTALRESIRKSRGMGWSLFWLSLVFGLSSWGLAHLPLAGGFLSTAVVGTVQAVSLAVLVRHTERRK